MLHACSFLDSTASSMIRILRVYALDYGGVGYVSDVFRIVR